MVVRLFFSTDFTMPPVSFAILDTSFKLPFGCDVIKYIGTPKSLANFIASSL
ncbi:MAG: hypothetical protein BWY23_02754 [Spirochaetes bacterium ADurb.Bin218]|nr:MAG: hypothetical protein BWY23_02754 [Spirochaetes bacterium ADurb.Bin218]